MCAKIGFVGAGKMATAMIEGLLSKGLYKKDEIIACSRTQKTKDRISKDLGIEATTDASKVFS